MDHLKYPENVTVHTQQTLHSLFWPHPGRLIARSDGPLFLDRRWHTRHCSGGLTPPCCGVSAPPVRAAASATAKRKQTRRRRASPRREEMRREQHLFAKAWRGDPLHFPLPCSSFICICCSPHTRVPLLAAARTTTASPRSLLPPSLPPSLSLSVCGWQ